MCGLRWFSLQRRIRIKFESPNFCETSYQFALKHLRQIWASLPVTRIISRIPEGKDNWQLLWVKMAFFSSSLSLSLLAGQVSVDGAFQSWPMVSKSRAKTKKQTGRHADYRSSMELLTQIVAFFSPSQTLFCLSLVWLHIITFLFIISI